MKNLNQAPNIIVSRKHVAPSVGFRNAWCAHCMFSPMGRTCHAPSGRQGRARMHATARCGCSHAPLCPWLRSVCPKPLRDQHLSGKAQTKAVPDRGIWGKLQPSPALTLSNSPFYHDWFELGTDSMHTPGEAVAASASASKASCQHQANSPHRTDP